MRKGFGDARNLTIVIVEVERFASFRQMIGTCAAAQVMQALRAQVEQALAPCAIGRVGRTTIEAAVGSTDRDDLDRRFSTLLPTLSRRIDVAGARLDPVIRVGAARRASEREEELLDQAAACLEAAREEHAAVRWAEDNDPSRHHADAALMTDLAAAIEFGELDLFHQPKLDTKTDRIDAVEALLRWPARSEPTNVARMIELAEQTGLISDVTDWVLRRAVVDQRRLTDAGFDVRVDVNISGVLLADRTFADRLFDVLAGSDRIGLEITETALIADPDVALANLNRCAAAGLHIAIDDYGSGLSSLAYLKRLPAHELKIDRMFVSGLVESHRDPLLVRSSIDLAHALEMKVTAEGVDNPMALALLKIMGCDLVQGYLVAAPMPLAELIGFLRGGAAEHPPVTVPLPKSAYHTAR